MSAIKCRKCGDIIASKYRHDFVWCKCHSVAIDGGTDYIRIIGNREDFELINNIQQNDTNKENTQWN